MLWFLLDPLTVCQSIDMFTCVHVWHELITPDTQLAPLGDVGF